MSRKTFRSNEFFERVELLRNQIDMKQTEFSKSTEIPNSFYSDMKKGRSGPSVIFIVSLFKLFKPLNPYWLFFGEEPQYFNLPRVNQPQNDIIVDLILRISRLKPSKRAAIISIIEANLKLIEGP